MPSCCSVCGSAACKSSEVDFSSVPAHARLATHIMFLMTVQCTQAHMAMHLHGAPQAAPQCLTYHLSAHSMHACLLCTLRHPCASGSSTQLPLALLLHALQLGGSELLQVRCWSLTCVSWLAAPSMAA